MVGPWLSIAVAVSLYAACGPEHRFIGRWGLWAIGMAAGALVSAVYTLIQVLVDVTLLALRQRAFATGRNAWLMASGGSLAVCASYVVMAPWKFYKHGPWGVVAAILAPILVVTLGVRLFAGPRIEKTAG
jgi:hypothetical protein